MLYRRGWINLVNNVEVINYHYRLNWNFFSELMNVHSSPVCTTVQSWKIFFFFYQKFWKIGPRQIATSDCRPVWTRIQFKFQFQSQNRSLKPGVILLYWLTLTARNDYFTALKIRLNNSPETQRIRKQCWEIFAHFYIRILKLKLILGYSGYNTGVGEKSFLIANSTSAAIAATARPIPRLSIQRQGNRYYTRNDNIISIAAGAG